MNPPDPVVDTVEYLKRVCDWSEPRIEEFVGGRESLCDDPAIGRAVTELWMMIHDAANDEIEAHALKLYAMGGEHKKQAAIMLGRLYTQALIASDITALEFLGRQKDCIANDITRIRRNESMLTVLRAWMAVLYFKRRHPMSQKEIMEIAAMAGDTISKTRASQAVKAMRARLAKAGIKVKLDGRGWVS